jgi:hypothetical protein
MDTYNMIVVKKEKKTKKVNVQFIEKLKFSQPVRIDINKIMINSTKSGNQIELLTKNKEQCDELFNKLINKRKIVINKELNDFEKNLTELEKVCFEIEKKKTTRKRARTDITGMKFVKRKPNPNKYKKKNEIASETKKGNLFMSLLTPGNKRSTTSNNNKKLFKRNSKLVKKNPKNKSVDKKNRNKARQPSRIKETLKKTFMYPFSKLFK